MSERLLANKAVVRGLFDAVNTRRFDVAARYLSPNVVDHNKIIVGEADRPGVALDGFRQQFDAFSEGGMFVRDLIAEDDQVVARLRVVGVHSGAHPRMPRPTGRRVDVEQIWIFTVTDGMITQIRGVSDRLGMFLQLGWDWPAPEPAVPGPPLDEGGHDVRLTPRARR